MTHHVVLIPGDGIGPEVTAAARLVLDATGVEIEWQVQEVGAGVMEAYGTPLPEEVLAAIREARAALKGPVTTPVGSGFRSVNVALRRALDLYANVRPARALPGIVTPFAGVDLVVVRENTEGLYVGVEHEVIPGEAAESVRVITRRASERVVRFACEYALANGWKRVTAVHKANILKLTDGLFLRAAREVAANYPELEFDDLIVDNACMQLVRWPQEFDVLVLPNLYGDIVSDLAAGLVGGLGVTPSANVGEGIAVFEPVHGSAPSLAGKDEANPTAAILSGALLLRHLGEGEAAARVEAAVAAVLAEGRSVTADVAPDGFRSVGTRAMAEAVVAAL
jgi:isocitrate dehydrogenase (NAD+)